MHSRRIETVRVGDVVTVSKDSAPMTITQIRSFRVKRQGPWRMLYGAGPNGESLMFKGPEGSVVWTERPVARGEKLYG